MPANPSVVGDAARSAIGGRLASVHTISGGRHVDVDVDVKDVVGVDDVVEVDVDGIADLDPDPDKDLDPDMELGPDPDMELDLDLDMGIASRSSSTFSSLCRARTGPGTRITRASRAIWRGWDSLAECVP